MSLAERVAEEMAERLGDLVGYSVRLETKRSDQTRLEFVTTGVLLRRIQSDPLLKDITHILVDEVHERDMNTYESSSCLHYSPQRFFNDVTP